MLADLDVQCWWDWKEPIPHFHAEDYTLEWADDQYRYLKRHVWIVPIPFFVINLIILKRVNNG